MDINGPIINHLAYTYDIIIFGGGNNRSINLIHKQVRRYEKASGQKVNKDKNFFITAPNTAPNRINRMREASGYMDKNFPFNYLECPIYSGTKRISYFDGMLAKIMKKLNGWQRKMLSYGGRTILIKHVLHSLPIYILSAMNPPKGIFKLMERHFTNFLWSSSDGKNKYHWESWIKLCIPKYEGGVGINKMEDISETLTLKRW